MAGRDQPEAEGKQIKAGGRTKAERKLAKKVARKQRGGASVAAVPGTSQDKASLEERIGSRLALIEEVVVAQSERSEQLLGKVDALLDEASPEHSPLPSGNG